MKIYVASSWRNEHQQEVVRLLRGIGHNVYDFKDADGFHWSEVDPTYHRGWSTTDQWSANLRHPAAIRGYNRDIGALEEADACVMVMPCGRSACLELGYAAGEGKYTAIYVPEVMEPELMFKMADLVSPNLETILEWSMRVASIGAAST